MKIKNTNKQIRLDDLNREVITGSFIEEQLTVRVDDELREFIKDSLDKLC